MPETRSLTLHPEGMSCASCVRRVETALRAVPGVTDARVNLAAETATVDYDAPADPAGLAAALARAGYPAANATAVLDIDGMSCASCVRRVETALKAVPGVTDARVNLAAETATVDYLAGAATPALIAAASGKAGYAATPRAGEGAALDPSAATDDGTAAALAGRKARQAAELGRLALAAGLLALPVFLLEMGGHMSATLHMWIMDTIGMQASRLIQFVLATVVLAWPGRRFFTTGIPALLRGSPDMNSLVALGTGAAWSYSTIATFAPGLLPAAARNVYFEAAVVIVALILLGRMMEARAKGRAGEAIRHLVGLRAKTARVERPGGPEGVALEDVALEAIAAGDVILVRPGETVATDGVVISGETFIDESMITGEPAPVAKSEGAAVVGGTVNRLGAIRIRATKVGADTMLSQIIRMVEEAQGAKLPIEALVDRITAWFVPAVIAAALLAAAVWLVFGPDLAHALVAGVAVLIIACPCAMGLATPTSIMVGSGRAAELGVLFRRGDALQSLQAARVIAVDKTGTLTAGRPELTELIPADGFAEGDLLRLAAGAEAASEHPVAEAILRAAAARGIAPPEAAEFRVWPGYGLSAKVEGRAVLIGADRLLAREGIATGALAARGAELARRGRTPLYLAVDGRIAALIGVADPVKPATPAAVRALQDRGLRVAMITGDNEATARVIAAELGIDEVVAEVLPEGKVAAIRALRDRFGPVAFAGDGINDAPALAEADVGLAMGTGTDVAIESADVVLVSGSLAGAVDAVELSRRVMANIRQNLAWAFGYNIALIPVAAGVLYPVNGMMLSPALAAGAMALSSVFVLTNALRLRLVCPALADRPAAAPAGPGAAPVPAE